MESFCQDGGASQGVGVSSPRRRPAGLRPRLLALRTAVDEGDRASSPFCEDAWPVIPKPLPVLFNPVRFGSVPKVPR